MSGFHVKSSKYADGKTTYEWDYDGKQNIHVTPLYVTSKFEHKDDECSFILATLLPLAAIFNEDLTYFKPINPKLVDFWRVKMAGIQPFYKPELVVEVDPIGPDEPVDAKKCGDLTVLLYGGGTDSTATLSWLLDSGVKPCLLRLLHAGHPEAVPSNPFRRIIFEIGKRYGLDVYTPESNCSEFQRNIRRSILVRGFVSDYGSKYTDTKKSRYATYSLHGFQMFFQALSAVPDGVKTILMGCSAEDLTEPYGVGFNYNNDLPYFGIPMTSHIWDSKVAELLYIRSHKPDLLRGVKSCDKKQALYCGCCDRCSTMRSLQLALDLPEYVPNFVSRRAKHVVEIKRCLSALAYYKSTGGRDPDVLRELEWRAHLRQDV